MSCIVFIVIHGIVFYVFYCILCIVLYSVSYIFFFKIVFSFLYCIVPYCIVLYRVVLHFIVLQCQYVNKTFPGTKTLNNIPFRVILLRSAVSYLSFPSL